MIDNDPELMKNCSRYIIPGQHGIILNVHPGFTAPPGNSFSCWEQAGIQVVSKVTNSDRVKYDAVILP